MPFPIRPATILRVNARRVRADLANSPSPTSLIWPAALAPNGRAVPGRWTRLRSRHPGVRQDFRMAPTTQPSLS